MGSSPLTRGKLFAPRWATHVWRLIPAHAGKTTRRNSAFVPVRAHPRSRGENFTSDLGIPGEAGSSPLTRGKRWLASVLDPAEGLIPAHAGKTVNMLLDHASSWAHPRSRGENNELVIFLPFGQGSSPLTRGKLLASRCTVMESGLIPAHAGKTLPDLRFYRADRSDLGKP